MTRETPKPTQFFPNSTLVKDFFDGDGANPSLLMTYGEIIVVMFYAPWNLKSKEAKMPFLQTSLAFSHLPNVNLASV